MSTKLLIADVFDGEALAHLIAKLDCKIARARELKPTPDEMAEAEGLIIRSRTKVDRMLLDQAPHLRWIVTATAGFDHIDVKACTGRKIEVAHTPQANAEAASELTIALLLMAARRIPLALGTVKKNQWRNDSLRGLGLTGHTLGIVGLGRVGRRVARIAQALGMKIIAYDPYVEESIFQKESIVRLGLTEVLIAADFLSLHVPLTKETHHLLNHPTFRILNPEAWVINTSRGPVIDENELLVALDEGLLKGAALDVFEREPLPNESRLRGRDNVILSPHIGAFTDTALVAASMAAAEATVEFFTSGQVINPLPCAAPWFSQLC